MNQISYAYSFVFSFLFAFVSLTLDVGDLGDLTKLSFVPESCFNGLREELSTSFKIRAERLWLHFGRFASKIFVEVPDNYEFNTTGEGKWNTEIDISQLNIL